MSNVDATEYSAWTVALGERLRALRAESGLSQERLAGRAGLSKHTYAALERGQSRQGGAVNPTLFTLMRVASVLGCPVASLLPAWPVESG